MIEHRYCVIMCGGVGSRFWPYSRADRPKQFLDFFGTGTSLLQMTYDRMKAVVSEQHILVVTNSRYAALIQEQLPNLPKDNMLLEPARRNTAPCIAWAAHHIYAKDPEATLIVTPSDHLITREEVFNRCVARGFEFVEQHEALLTFGIRPTRPETGYGYIQIGQPVEADINKVKTFTEKPDLELARVFVDSGEFFWNSGIFLYRAKTILEAIAKTSPDLALVFDKGKEIFGTPEEEEFITINFSSCPSISIDYAVMEKAQNVYVECVSFGWNDLGTWSSLYDNSPHDGNANMTNGSQVMAYESSGNILAVPREKLVAVWGLRDYIVADTGDVLLICPKSEEQRIKSIVSDVKLAHGDKFQ